MTVPVVPSDWVHRTFAIAVVGVLRTFKFDVVTMRELIGKVGVGAGAGTGVGVGVGEGVGIGLPLSVPLCTVLFWRE